MYGLRKPAYRSPGVLYLNGPLHGPLTGDLRHAVLAQLRHGEPAIILDLSAVSSIDAAGVGQLVRAYNVTNAANGILRIVRATPWVRDVLERLELFGLLSEDPDAGRSTAFPFEQGRRC